MTRERNAADGGSLVVRGDIPKTECMQTLQIGYLHAVAAAAGCSLQPHNQDYRGIDWDVTHGASLHHSEEGEATIKVQLKATTQYPLPPDGEDFALTLRNQHLAKLNYKNPTVPRLLVAMLAPAEMAEWIKADHNWTELRRCCYWVNLAGVELSGKESTNIRIPTAQIFDDVALCDIMLRVGAGGKP
ncbi:DUF4365 domain-containing protein [Microbispora cellulosiformans]|uniref:DUF4365 domain-containing protein n=1 Tax=Microbispora cellulosiformans TaxID=2614688 RepID=A0A5J5JWC8_9ACTN|nr:DUF4365 domain-containing protein [Microbispora cellulosiformans]KAA9374849.1 DUF4365 domain-containing protein [Microbispora cellulosiformans]